MGLFVQDIKVGLQDTNHVVEKITIKNIKKGKINLYVRPGCNCIIPTLGNQEFIGKSEPYQLLRESFVQTKGDSCEVYVYLDKGISLPIPFFGGQYNLPIPGAKGLRGTYALVGTCYLQITDYAKISSKYGDSVTQEQIIEDLKTTYRKAISDEIALSANKLLDGEIDENKFNSITDKITTSMIEDSGKANNLLRELGLRLSARKTTMHLNPLDDVLEITKKISDKQIETTIYDMDASKRKDEADKLQAERQYEIDQIKAHNTKVNESKQDTNTNVNKNINGNIKEKDDENKKKEKEEISFCPSCGNKITMSDAIFCPKCGRKLK